MTLRALAFSTVVAALAAMSLALAPTASAHDELLRSAPRDGAVLAAPPGVVTLVFEEAPAEGFTTVSVTGPGAARVNAGGPVTSGATITEQLAAPGRSGRYLIRYRIMSDDGHPVSGTIRFTVRARGATTTATSTVAAEAGTRPPSRTLGAIAGITVFGVLVLAVLRLRRPR
jgi:methionine-rich copper-binding protein CopC